MGTRIITTVLAILVLWSIVILSHYDRQKSWVVGFVVVTKAIESLSDVIFGWLQQHERLDLIAWSMILKGTGSLILMVAGLLIFKSLVLATACLAGGALLTFAFYDQRCPSRLPLANSQYVHPNFNRRAIRKIITMTLPLGAVMLCLTLQTSIPRYFLEGFHRPRDLGIFSALAYVSIAGGLIVNALAQSAVPRLSRHFANNEMRQYYSLLTNLILLGVVLGLVGVAFALSLGSRALTIIYTAEYAQYSSVFVVMMIGGGVSYVQSFLGYGLTCTRKFASFLVPYAVVTVICAFASALLIPKYGIMGAALAVNVTVVCTCVSLVVIHFKIYRELALCHEIKRL